VQRLSQVKSIVRELWVPNICVRLACSSVVLLAWWVAGEWIGSLDVKLLARRVEPLQLGVDLQSEKPIARLSKPEFTLKDLVVPPAP